MKPTLVVLAAGIGSRYQGLKQIDAIGPGGEAIIDYSIYDAIRAGFGKVVFVVRRSIEEDVRRFFEPKLRGRIDLDFVLQETDMIPDVNPAPVPREKPWGTAHAVLCARSAVREPFAVINGDDFYGQSSYTLLHQFLVENQDSQNYAMVGFQLEKTLSDYGSVARGVCQVNDDGTLRNITEHTRIYRADGKIITEMPGGDQSVFTGKEIVSMNFWGFMPGVFDYFEELFRKFLKEKGQDPKAEYFIPIPLARLISEGTIRLTVLDGQESWFGVTYKEDKPGVVKRIRDFISAGQYPEKLWE